MLDPIAEFSWKQVFIRGLKRDSLNNKSASIDDIVGEEIKRLTPTTSMKDFDVMISIDFEVDRVVMFNYWSKHVDDSITTFKAFYLLDWFSDYSKFNKKEFAEKLAAAETTIINAVLAKEQFNADV